MNKKGTEKKYIFISYDYDDCGVVFPLASTFKEEGYDVFMNTVMSHSKEIEEEIEKDIKGCSLFMFLATRQSLDNSFCSRELLLADKYEKTQITVFLQEKYDKFKSILNPRLKQFPVYEFCDFQTAKDFVMFLENNNPDVKKLKNKKKKPDSVKPKKTTSKSSLNEYEEILKQNIKNDPDDFEYGSDKTKKTLNKYNGSDAVVIIPNSVTTLTFYSFNRDVEVIVLSKNVRKIEDGAFTGADELVKIIVDPENPYYASIDGVLFDKDVKKLIHYPRLKTNTEYRAPSSVDVIKKGAFNFVPSLTSLTFDGDGLTIESKAIQFIFRLRNITIKKRVKRIEKFAISCCTSLEKILYYQNYSSWLMAAEEGFYANEKIGFFARLFGKRPHLVELNCKDRIITVKPANYKW